VSKSTAALLWSLWVKILRNSFTMSGVSAVLAFRALVQCKLLMN
jgi:hypothetical protein